MINNGTCVVVIPADAVGDEHCTLTYMGDIPIAPPVGQIEFLVRNTARWWTPIVAQVDEHDTFGGDDPVQVARLNSTILASLQAIWQPFSTSEFSFRPHITALPGISIRPVGSLVRFNRLALWYGDDRKTYRLGTGDLCAA